MKSKIAIFLSIFAISSQVIFGQSQAFSHQKSSKDIIIHVVGDVHGEKAIKREALPMLKKYFKSGDLNIFNLETAITDANVKEEKEYNFKTDLAFLKALKEIGFNVATVANNHSYDYGLQGFMDTLQSLKAAGSSYVGGGKNS